MPPLVYPNQSRVGRRGALRLYDGTRKWSLLPRTPADVGYPLRIAQYVSVGVPVYAMSIDRVSISTPYASPIRYYDGASKKACRLETHSIFVPVGYTTATNKTLAYRMPPDWVPTSWWASTWTGATRFFAQASCLDSAGNVYIAGPLYDPTCGMNSLTVSKLSGAGVQRWVQQTTQHAVPLWADYGYAIARNGSVYAGTHQGVVCSLDITSGAINWEVYPPVDILPFLPGATHIWLLILEGGSFGVSSTDDVLAVIRWEQPALTDHAGLAHIQAGIVMSVVEIAVVGYSSTYVHCVYIDKDDNVYLILEAHSNATGLWETLVQKRSIAGVVAWTVSLSPAATRGRGGLGVSLTGSVYVNHLGKVYKYTDAGVLTKIYGVGGDTAGLVFVDREGNIFAQYPTPAGPGGQWSKYKNTGHQYWLGGYGRRQLSVESLPIDATTLVPVP